ncbi:MAG: ABC transporter substrate-binding protein [Bacteroidetes bacterium GWF2_43_63]|nr:MAG: ABC transporter substrate-binding protein [Bacteroidetes bacterium GWE2_42_42]OFY56087.1 MAG: ABC transporter substrate-binding protein [Bacteroidetes bacterium GWF2_43_63]HBG70658.1 ABC transporter substrate-binding protein [Bacteroidales bacterium]HCB62514.1 ABC transporter substrate-binding protein [Bacteroidales bacterium]HCY21969.1 ABC transporter substrate-binding protein [Bacteroidales bacterium]
MRKLLPFIVVSLLLISCGRKHQVPENIKLFRYNEAAGIRSLDPAFARDQANIWGVNQLFNGLVQLDDSLQVKPCIAKSWEISDDGLLYTFHLRSDVFFHPSEVFNNQKRKVIAADVDYSLQRLADEKTASPGKWVLGNVACKSDGKLDIIVSNDTTVAIRLIKPFAPFLSLLSMQYCSVVPREAVEFYGKDFGHNPVGTGPFLFKYWKDGLKLVLLKNPDYFEIDKSGKRLPYLDGVVVTFIVEKHTAFMEFMQGNYDMISGLDPNYKDVLLDAAGNLKPEHNNKMYMTRIPYLNTEYLGISVQKSGGGAVSALQEQKIRLAVNYGFDRRKMMRYLRNNIGYPGLYGMIPPGLTGYAEDSEFCFEYNPSKSKQLLAEAGYPNGIGLPEIVLQTTATYQDLCEYIQQQLAEISIKIKLDVVPPATLREMVSQSKSGFFRASWIADYPDAENYMSLFYSKNEVPNGPNYTHFANAEFDRLYEEAVSSSNDSLRAELYEKMNRIIMEQAPVVVLYYDMAVRFVSNRIKGLEPNAMNLLVLKNVRKE